MSQAEGPQISPPKAESRDDAGAAEARVDVETGNRRVDTGTDRAGGAR